MANKKSARIVDDLSPRVRELIEKAEPPRFSNQPLNKNRDSFTEREREIANRIGTPQQEGFGEK